MIIHGDCLEKLKLMDENSVDAAVTDPPYGLSFMGKKWDYDVPSVELWREVLRVLKPGGHVLSFGGTRTYHRLACNIEDAGFDIRDQIMWIYGSGFPKSHNGPHGGTALKPANEPICLARKPLIGTVAKNFEQFGTGGLNIDGTRIVSADFEPKERLGATKLMEERPWSKQQLAGERKTIIEGNSLGRWPANILFDEEAAAMLDEQSGISKSPLGNVTGTKASGGIMNNGLGRTNSWTGHGDSGGASRFFYVAKASKAERNLGLEGEIKEKQGARPNSADATGKFPDHDHRPSGGNNHPTVKPIKLMEYLIKLITPPNGIVLDPFMGSGSTGVAAKNLGFQFIGIEMNEEYIEIAKRRING